MKRRLRIITYAWGVDYVRRLLDITLAAVLAPGNLPALAEIFACEFVLLTERSLFATVEASPTYQRIGSIAEARLVPIDDLLVAPLYGMTLTYATYRGMADLGEEVTDTDFLFFTADWVPADGSYRSLIPHLRRRERLIVAPSYCAVTEDVLPALRSRLDEKTAALAIPKRELAALIIANRHNTVRGKTINTHLFHMDVIEQFYWLVDRSTLLSHQMPIAIVCMRPERWIPQPNSFWDYGTVSELCPTSKPCVLADSDEFLMLELRGESTHDDGLRLGWPSHETIGRKLATFVTKDHSEYGRHQLVLHSGDLPADTKMGREELKKFVHKIYGYFEGKEIGYAKHPYWEFQSTLFDIARKAAGLSPHSSSQLWSQNSRALTSAINDELSECHREAENTLAEFRHHWLVGAHGSSDEGAVKRGVLIEALDARLQTIEQAVKVAQAIYQRDIVLTLKDVREERTTTSDRDDEFRYLIEKQAGREPAIVRLRGRSAGGFDLRMRKTNPMWAPFRFAQRLTEVKSWPHDVNVLSIASDAVRTFEKFIRLPAHQHIVMSAFTAANLDPTADLIGNDKFSLCLVELDGTDLLKLRRIYDRVLPVMRRGGKFIVYFHNQSLRTLEGDPLFIRRVFPRCDYGRVYFAGSFISVVVIHVHRRILRMLGRAVTPTVSEFVAQIIMAAPAYVANVYEAWRHDSASAMPNPRFCTSMTIEIDI
jgi:hypothetical protein